MDEKQAVLQHALGQKWLVWPSSDGTETYISNGDQTNLARSLKEGPEILLCLTNDELKQSSVDSIKRALNSVWDEFGASILARYLP